jgi:hypothetical protein
VQRRTAALSPKGRFELVRGGHFIQTDQLRCRSGRSEDCRLPAQLIDLV